ncbi:MAG: polysaccharide biosynthesis C-terminal domain-containing protein [Burkholderiales bacterium]|nr:polysaccharide biosynthesis C-terminal domain-containing protein [Burkholderiales bacterium]
MSNQVENRFIKTSSVSILSTVLNILLQITTVPICLHYWGNTMYGTWLSVSAAFTLLRAIDGGYNTYIGNKLNILYHQDKLKMHKIMASSVYGIALLGFIQVILVALLYYIVNYNLFPSISFNLSDKNSIIGLFIICLFWAVFCSYIGILHRMLITVGMLYQLLWWMLVLQVMQNIAILASAYYNFNIIHTAIMFASSQAFIYIFSAIYIKIKLKEMSPWLSGATVKVGVKDIFNSMPMTVNGVIQQGGTSWLVILVSLVINVAAIPAYTTMRTMNNLWITAVNVLTAPLLPDVVRFYATKEMDKFRKVHQLHIILMSILVNLSILILYPFISSLYNIWTKHSLVLDLELLVLLFVSTMFYAYNSLFNVFLNGINHSRYLIISGLIRGVLVIILSYVLLKMYGLDGVGYAILISEILMLVVNTNYFIPKVMAAYEIKCNLFFWYNYLSLLPGILFLILDVYLHSDNFLGNDIWFYCVALISTLLGIYFSWVNLDIDVKKRVFVMFRLAR